MRAIQTTPSFILGLSLALFFSINNTNAQKQLLDSVFAEVEVTTHDYTTEGDEVLQFDMYRATIAEGALPLIVFVHGGGFSGGSRDSRDIVSFSTRLANHGYAVASVSYRLLMKGIGFGCDVPADDKIATIDAASLDISYAIQKILKQAAEFDVDRANFIIAGSSAGAEVVLNMAYVYDNPILPSDFRFAGVIGMAGAITTLDGINESTAIPTQLFHGTGDQLVPYSVAPHHYCFARDKGHLILYGSGAIAERLKGLGTAYYLYAEPGGTHAWAGRPMSQCFAEIVDFIYHDVVNPDQTRQTERFIKYN